MLPEISPGILRRNADGVHAVLDDFVISYYTTGTEFVTLPVYIYNLVQKTGHARIFTRFTV